MCNNGRIEELLDKLDQSIIYQMSLNSHELFHSNLWAWLMREPAVIELFFPEVATKKIKIKREEGSRDITIWEGDKYHKKAYVIENKFKSIPTIEQLVRYQTKLGDKFAKGVLTGILIPSIPVGIGPLKDWHFLSYEEIATGLRKIAETTEIWDAFTKDVVNQYANMVLLLCKIVKEDLDNNVMHCQCLCAPKDDALFEETRIRDLLIKIHADALCEGLRNSDSCKSIQQSLPDNYSLIIKADYARKSGIVDICLQKKLPNENQFDLQIGVQIQGQQFKLFVSKGKQHSSIIPEEVFREYLEKQWFEDYSQHPRLFKNRATNMSPKQENKNQFNTFEERTYCFVYQFFTITPEMDDAIVKSLIWKYLGDAVKIISP